MIFLKKQIGKIKRFIYKKIKTIYGIGKKKRVIENYKDSPKYLNVGGGQFVRKHWRVLDYTTPDWYNYSSIFVDFNINLEKSENWPIEKESYDLIYTSHTLEHLSQNAVIHTLKEAHRILKRKGGLRITIPDIDLILSHYKKKDREWFEMKYPAFKKYDLEYFLLKVFATHLIDRISSEQVRKDFEIMNEVSFLDKYIGLIENQWQKEKPGLHRNWFNFEKLEKLLKEAGFSNIVRNCPNQSIFTELCYKDFDNTHPGISIFVDAIKL